MTADRDKTQSQAGAGASAEAAAPAATPLISRRMLLRGATAAVPTILTLNSGVAAAAAAASGMVAINPNAGPQTFEGHQGWMCVNTGNEVVDSKMALGNAPVTYVIPDPASTGIEYRQGSNWGTGVTKQPAEMCWNGGTYMYKPRTGDGGQTINMLQGGGMASAAALASFGGSVVKPTSIF